MEQSLLTLRLEAGEDDPETIHRLTGQLRDRLLDLDVDEVSFVRAPLETGSKSGLGAIVAGTLTVLTIARPAHLRAIVDMAQAFLRRHDGRRIQLELGENKLTIDGASGKDITAAIDGFLRASDQEPAQ